MFTGIVQGQAQVYSIKDSSEESFRSLLIQFPKGTLSKVSKGASIAINGTCLTVTSFDESAGQANFDVISETLEKTNLGSLSENDYVNFERAARYGDEIGGHIMSGHIFTTVALLEIEQTPSNTTMTFELPKAAEPYVLTKGFVGLNGCSLTVGEVSEQQFNVHLIPETLEQTTFGKMAKGSVVNLEVDPSTQAIVDTVERVMAKNGSIVKNRSLKH